MPFDWTFNVGAAPPPSDITGDFLVMRQSPLGVAPMLLALMPDFDNLQGTSVPTTPPGRNYIPRYHELYYEWTITPLGYDFQKVDRPAGYRAAETRHGPTAMFVLRGSGPYLITLLITEAATGRQGQLTRTIDVADPSTVFTNANTWVVDSTGTGTLEFPNANIVTTFDAAADAIRGSADRTSPRKIVGLRGQTYNTNRNGFAPNSNTIVPSVHVVAAGSGDRPILNAPDGYYHNDLTGPSADVETVWQGWDMRGTYDPQSSTDPPTIGDLDTGYQLIANPPHVTLFDDFLMSGYHQYLYCDQSLANGDPITDAGSLFINDSSLKGHYYYGLFGSFHQLMLAGSYLGSDEDGWWGQVGDVGKYGSRFPRIGDLHLHNCDVFTMLSLGRYQSSFRTGNNGRPDGTRVQVTGTRLEGGTQAYLNSIVAGSAAAEEMNTLFDRSYVLASAETNKGVVASRGAFTMRSCFVVTPDVSYVGQGGLQSLVELVSPDVPAGQLDAPVKVYSNTLINLSSESPSFVADLGGYTDKFIGNNLELTAAQAASADYDLANLFCAPICVGLRSDTNPAGPKSAGSITPVDSAPLARPVSNTTVNGVTGSVASGEVALYTFDGSLNPGVIGALAETGV